MLAVLALLVAAPTAQAVSVDLTQPTDGAQFQIANGVLPQISYAATLTPGLDCLAGTWAIERRTTGSGDAWSTVVSAPVPTPALAKLEAAPPAGGYDVRAIAFCDGIAPTVSAISSIRVLAEVPDVPDVPDVPLPDPGTVLPDPGIQLPGTGEIALPDGGSLVVPPDGLIPVDIANGVQLPGETGQIIALAPGTIDTKLCMVALSDVQAVRDLVRQSRRRYRKRRTAQRRRALANARELLVQAKAAERESCL